MSHSNPTSTAHPQDGDNDIIDLVEVVGRLRRATFQILGLALLGVVIFSIGSFISLRFQPAATSTRVVFSFPGFEKGQYPDGAKFQADDLRSPAVVAEALRRQRLDTSSDFQSAVRGGLSIEGTIPAAIAKERERLRANGQNPPVYIPDEYAVTLSIPARFALTDRQRENLLREIVSVFTENFSRSYTVAPLAFGSAFDTIRNADFAEFELILNTDLDNIRNYLSQEELIAKSFRSPSTNLTFRDLAEQTELFAQIHLNEVLGLIHENGLSRNRRTAMLKMDYYLRQLEEREQHAIEDEKVVRDLLNQTQARGQNYVLGIKSQAAQPRTESPLLDQGLIDSLLANDSYNFLVRRALDTGLKVKAIQAEKGRLLSLRDNMKTFVESKESDQSTITRQVEVSLKEVEVNYRQLVDRIRLTHQDFARQHFGDAIRFSDQVKSQSVVKAVALYAAIGAVLGAVLGAGLGLLGVVIGHRLSARPSSQPA